MTSKNSFLVSMKENSKRRLWVWVISVLGFMLLLPLYAALRISQIHQQWEWMISRYGTEMAEKIIHENLLITIKSILGGSDILFILTVILAVVSAVQGFSWLYSRKKIDFYMGMPVKRSKRLLVIWLNGILIYLIPYILGLMIGMLIAAGNQGLDVGVVKVIFQALFVNLLLYLSIYHMAMLAVMLTGNIVITGMGFLVFCLYEWLVRRVDHVYKSRFFRYFTWRSNPDTMRFSPFSMYLEIVNSPAAMMSQVKMIMLMILFAVLAGGLACLAYFNRPAEGAGKAMVFEFTKPIVKILLVVPMALVVGDMIANDVNYAPEWGLQGGGYVIFALALATILGCAVIQVLYEFDIKGALHRKRHILISGVLVAFLFLIYRYDLLHFDSYVPDADDVESIAFYPYQYDNADYKALWFEPEHGDMSGRDYVDRYMYLTNAEDVCELVEYSMEKYNKDMAENKNRGYGDDLVFVSNAYWSEARIIYRLKSGREVMRRLWIDVDDEASAGYLDRIIGSEEFKEGYLMGASDRLSRIIEENDRYEIRAYYGNMVYEQKLTQPELLELLECYQADMEFYNFTKIKESVPAGVIRIEFEKDLADEGYGRGTSTIEMGINIYPFFENSIAYLKKFGFYMERQAVVEDIDRIYIKNYNSEANAELQELQRTGMAEDFLNDPEATAEVFGANEIDTRRYADYTQKADIEQIADYIYAEGMLSGRWDNGAVYDPDYEIMVYFKADSDMSRKYGTTANYKFKEDEIPDFVKSDTAFQMENK